MQSRVGMGKESSVIGAFTNKHLESCPPEDLFNAEELGSKFRRLFDFVGDCVNATWLGLWQKFNEKGNREQVSPGDGGL